VDDVRISTFASGAFNATNLLYAPSPQAQLSITRNGNNVVLSAPANRTLARLMSVTNLNSPYWRYVDVPERLAFQTKWTNTLSGAENYYRFDPARSPVPVVLESHQDSNLPVPFWSDSFSATAEFYALDGYPSGGSMLVIRSHDIEGSAVSADDPLSFDASTSLDPLSETTNTLSFHYVLFESTAHGGRYYSGLADYYSPVLQIPMWSLPDLPDNGDADSQFWRVILVIRHIPFTPGLSQKTVCAFRFQYLFSPIVDDQYFGFPPPY